MTPTITAFERSPDRGKGLARDMRVRWALEEVGQSYEVRLLSFTEMKEPAHRALHPFEQVPTYEEGDLALFESEAIVFHIAESGGFHWQATDRVTKVRSGVESSVQRRSSVIGWQSCGHCRKSSPLNPVRMAHFSPIPPEKFPLTYAIPHPGG